MSLHTLCILTGELEENCYVLWRDGATDALVFDPGDDAARIEAELAQRGLKIAALMQTHCHCDHIGALGELKARHPDAPIYVPEREAPWLQKPTLNLSYFIGKPIIAPPADILVKPDEVLTVADFKLKALHVPGHSPGSTAYFAVVFGETPHLFCGDILMNGSIGRTDLPGGEGQDLLVAGIQQKLFLLPEETVVHPGHGAETTIGAEKKGNPFCGLGN